MLWNGYETVHAIYNRRDGEGTRGGEKEANAGFNPGDGENDSE